MSKKILITGSSAGFGLLTVKTLLKAGHEVAASMRDPQGRNKDIANELQDLGAKIVEIDVTNEESVNKGVQAATTQLNDLDVVINNAGVGVSGIQECFTTDDWQRLFEINVFGVQRMSRAVLPYFREKQDGLILNVSSLLGRMTLPFYGPYNASKWALEAMSENYRYELGQFGVDVALVEPGGFPTSFMERLITPSDNDRTKSYGEFAEVPAQSKAGFEEFLKTKPEQNPQLVADAILNVIDAPKEKRPFRTIVDKVGMGDALQGYNDSLAEVTKGIYSAFGMDQMYR